MKFFIPHATRVSPLVELEKVTIVAESESDHAFLAAVYRALRHGGELRAWPDGAKPAILGGGGSEPIDEATP